MLYVDFCFGRIAKCGDEESKVDRESEIGANDEADGDQEVHAYRDKENAAFQRSWCGIDVHEIDMRLRKGGKEFMV